MIEILWHEEDADGYTDLIPGDWFRETGVIQERTHKIIGPKGGQYDATCDISVDEASVDLDYQPYETINCGHSYIGTMRIKFADNLRSNVIEVLWKNYDSETFETCSSTVSYSPELENNLEQRVRDSLRLSPRERRLRLERAQRIPNQFRTTITEYHRNPDVVAEVLYLADGKCNRCKKPAPFNRAATDAPYLEVHHTIHLANGGQDTVENAEALCPNCHREAHYGARP